MNEQNGKDLVLYFGHHKCGTSWFTQILWHLSADLGLKFRGYNRPEQFEELGLREIVERDGIDWLSLRNARWENVAQLPAFRGFHVVRDPRDIVVSGYFSHLKTHHLSSDTIAQAREQLAGLSKEEGLIAEMDGISGAILAQISEWNYGEREEILEMRMEEISADPDTKFREVFQHLGIFDESSDLSFSSRISFLVNQLHRRSKGASLVKLPCGQVSAAHLDRQLEKSSFQRLAKGRTQGEVDEKSHYRSGKHGDWRNHFTPKVLDAFQERFGDLVVRLGYEKSEDWV